MDDKIRGSADRGSGSGLWTQSSILEDLEAQRIGHPGSPAPSRRIAALPSLSMRSGMPFRRRLASAASSDLRFVHGESWFVPGKAVGRRHTGKVC
ncbi:MAG: hypothetical protein ACYDGY_08750 [Acidimicrobiales bacterium]